MRYMHSCLKAELIYKMFSPNKKEELQEAVNLWFHEAEKDDEERAYIYAKCHKDEINEKWIPVSKN